MIESLRRWGGDFANVPVFAITPRRGPALLSGTLKAFKRLNVRYLYKTVRTPYSWFQFYNKPLCLSIAEELADTETVAWLDSDMLIVGEPEALRLEAGVDFAACVSSKEMGTCGRGDAFEPLWQTNCRALGIDIESLPWLVSEPEGARIRLYWQGGIFVYRTFTKFGRSHLNICTQLMDARNRPAVSFSIGINEMSAIGFAMHLMRLKWRMLPYSHNYDINWRRPDWHRHDEFHMARIIHYHDSMLPYFWDKFLQHVDAGHPQVAKWLLELGPMRTEASYINRAWSRALTTFRDRKQEIYIKSCRMV
jgi:hypothetical protein